MSDLEKIICLVLCILAAPLAIYMIVGIYLLVLGDILDAWRDWRDTRKQ